MSHMRSGVVCASRGYHSFGIPFRSSLGNCMTVPTRISSSSLCAEISGPLSRLPPCLLTNAIVRLWC